MHALHRSTSMERRPYPARRSRNIAGSLLLALSLVLLWAAQARAQTGPQNGFDPGDPSQDIIIEGLGFSKLILSLEPGPALEKNRSYLSLAGLLEKNLCWSGVFNLHGGRSRYCRLSAEPNRIDMRLAMSLEGGRWVLRLHDAGPEALLLDEETLPLDGSVSENDVMDVVNRLTERITGEPGLLGSTIAFALHQPGYAKVIVATDTHGRRLRPISHNPEINLLPRFSPDGTAVVYTVLGRDGSRVYYQSLQEHAENGLRSHFLTPPGSLNTGGAFSPDGMHVAITMSVNENADLFDVNLKTDKRTALTRRLGIETQAHWSPDGKKLVFVSDRSGTPQIYLLDLETGEDLRLTFEGTYNADPEWSPDGQSILFTRRVRGTDQIHIMDQYGENVRPVTFGRYDAEQATWSPDGRQIVFASNRTGEFKLYVVSADGSGLRRLTHTPNRYGENSPSWTSRRLVR